MCMTSILTRLRYYMLQSHNIEQIEALVGSNLSPPMKVLELLTKNLDVPAVKIDSKSKMLKYIYIPIGKLTCDETSLINSSKYIATILLISGVI